MTVCNICGKDFDEFDELNRFNISQAPFYGSKYYGCGISIDLCCGCFDKLIASLEENAKHKFIKKIPLEEMPGGVLDDLFPDDDFDYRGPYNHEE